MGRTPRPDGRCTTWSCPRPCSVPSWSTSGRPGSCARAGSPSRSRSATTSARELNERLHRLLRESQILRVDHFLGKEPVIELEYLRFANLALAELWERESVSAVQITMAEDLASRAAAASTIRSAPCATSSRTTCCTGAGQMSPSKVHKFSYSEGCRKWNLRADAPHRAAGGLSSACCFLAG
jgi:Glucose-6-phosphate dehydrogenase, NAD binding domain/Glucose-6-phosphate dehydrogenase, C-terminal domain